MVLWAQSVGPRYVYYSRYFRQGGDEERDEVPFSSGAGAATTAFFSLPEHDSKFEEVRSNSRQTVVKRLVLQI